MATVSWLGSRLNLTRDRELNRRFTRISEFPSRLNGLASFRDSFSAGVRFVTTLIASANHDTTGAVSINLRHADGVSNRLDAWIDFNRDGDWLDPGEPTFTNYDLGLGNGERVLPFTIPLGASIGDTFARFRVSTAGGLAPAGLANDGEVEDQRVPIVAFGQPVDVTLAANRATVELVRIDDQLIIRRRGLTLFSMPADGAGPLTLAGSLLADVFEVSPDITTPVVLDGGAGTDRVLMSAHLNVNLTDALLSVAGVSPISLLSIEATSPT